MRKAFKAYDIRGIYGKDFNREDVYKIGFFLPALLESENILVGRDVRASSDEVFAALADGITDSGAHVYNMGLATTPMVYYTTAKHEFHASVQITASHNPAEYNGLKVSRTNAMPVGFDTGLKDLLQMAENQPVQIAKKKGKIIDFPAKDEYLDFLRGYKPETDNLNIAIDCSNGMAALLIKKIIGEEHHFLYDELNGHFPNHDPNPLEEENVKDLKKLVLDKKADIGIIFDGDADRVMFVDEKGQFISPDLMIALLGHYFIQEKGMKVLEDIRTSKSVKEYLEKMGAEVHTWRVGRAYAAPKLKEIDGVFGGELAGHYYFRDFFYSDSGILAALIVLDILNSFKKEGKKLSELIANIKNYANSGEINFKIKDKAAAIETLKDFFVAEEEPMEILDFDGIRLEFKNWWFNVRPSNTEPYLRLLVEAKSEGLLKDKLKQIKTVLKQCL